MSVEPSEENASQFKIHKHLLCSACPRFREYLEEKEETKVIILYDVGVGEFEAFSKWLYTKEVVVQELLEEEARDGNSGTSNDSDSDASEQLRDLEEEHRPQSNGQSPSPTNGIQEDNATSAEADVEANEQDRTWYAGVNRKGRVFARLLDLYIFADTYKIVSFKRAVMLRFQGFIGFTETLPCPTIVKHALDSLDFDKSMMCKYLIHCYGSYLDFKKMSKKRLATLSPAFLTAVLMIAFQRIEDDDNVVGWDDDWCDDHEHDGDEERKECEDGRPGDADMEKRRPRSTVTRPRRWGACC